MTWTSYIIHTLFLEAAWYVPYAVDDVPTPGMDYALSPEFREACVSMFDFEARHGFLWNDRVPEYK